MNDEECDKCGRIGMIGPMMHPMFGPIYACPTCKNLKKE